MNTKKALTMGLSLVLAGTLLVGCGGNNNSSTSDASGKTLKIAGLDGGYGTKGWEAVAKAFEEQTGAKVELQFEKNIAETLRPVITSGKDVPDIIYLSVGAEGGLTDTMVKEKQIEENFINKLIELKYIYRPDICDRITLEQNFRKKFERLNRVNLSDSEFNRLLEEITDPDVFASSKRLREVNTFMREDGTPLQYTLVNIKDWCKNEYEVINQLRINTKNSFQRYDVILLINGLPVVQIELKTLDVSPRRAMQQIVDYKNDSGNGYANTLLCFMQLFIVSNYSNTYYFANNNLQHFNFNTEEQFLPVYQWAREDNKKVACLDSFAEQFLPKCHLGEMISRYMVLIASEQKLLIMRPYQIYAVKAIVKCIEENRGNGIGLKNLWGRYLMLTQKDIQISSQKGYYKVALPLINHPNRV